MQTLAGMQSKLCHIKSCVCHLLAGFVLLRMRKHSLYFYSLCFTMILRYVGKDKLFILLRISARLITSQRAGVGKSLYVQRTVQRLKREVTSHADPPHVYIPMLQQRASPDVVLHYLLPYSCEPGQRRSRIIHFDVTPEVSLECTFRGLHSFRRLMYVRNAFT